MEPQNTPETTKPLAKEGPKELCLLLGLIVPASFAGSGVGHLGVPTRLQGESKGARPSRLS
jgi:hypothetical protein